MTGRSSQNKLVHFRPPAAPDEPDVPQPGSYVAVHIAGAAPHHLVGEWRTTLAPPSHRVRIPVAAG